MMKQPIKRNTMRSEETVKAMHDGSPWLFEKEPLHVLTSKRSFIQEANQKVDASKLEIDRKFLFLMIESIKRHLYSIFKKFFV